MTRRNALKGILEWGEMLGVCLPQSPKEEGERPLLVQLPKSVTELGTNELGDLYWKIGQETSWVGGKLAEVEIEHSGLETELAKAKAKVYLKAKKEAPTGTNGRGTDGGREYLQAVVLTDPAVEELTDLVDEAWAKKKYLEAAHEGLRRAQNNLSRELSRRGIKIAEGFEL